MSPLGMVLIVVTLAAGTAAALVETGGSGTDSRQGRRTGGRTGYGLLKMLAASAYVAFALHLGALESLYGQAVFLALVLSWLGDFFLIGDSRRAFLLGLAAFLLAHVAYAWAFSLRSTAGIGVAVGAVVMVGVAVAVLRWLRAAGLPQRMTTPVAAYLVAIGAMVALAAGSRHPLLLVGAVAFAASDVLVARQRFVAPAAINRRVGLPLYFAAQILLASSV